jgi:hypothetical protein
MATATTKEAPRIGPRHHAVRSLLAMALLASLASANTWAESGYRSDYTINNGSYKAPSADRPPVYDGDPISVPVKALIERLALGITEANYEAKTFRYDIDTLGQGLAVRLHFKF